MDVTTNSTGQLADNSFFFLFFDIFIELPPVKINDLMAGENYDLKGRNVHKEIANENDIKANQVANTVL